MSRKVHPDRGGTGEDQQKLNAAYEKWSKLLKGTCPAGRTHMWRKPGETADPSLAGNDTMTHQVPMCRAIPLWGGISEGGFAEVLVHKSKKLSQEEWVTAVRKGKLTNAIRKLKPQLRSGPWHVLCDNEKFLHAKASKKAYAARPLKMWHIPPRSLDLNPVERFWGWLRQQLRHKDLADLRKKRPPLGKTAYLVRVRRFLKKRRHRQRLQHLLHPVLSNVCVQRLSARGVVQQGARYKAIRK